MALWDIAGKVGGQADLSSCSAASRREKIPAYASLLRYGDTDVVVRYCEEALGRGYKDLKIHEITENEITAAAEVCQAPRRRSADGRRQCAVDRAGSARDGRAPQAARPQMDRGAGVAAGGFCRRQPGEQGRRAASPSARTRLSLTDFQRLIDTRAVDYIQPSVAKIGGISVMRDIFLAANKAGVAVAPHSAYFGPGLIATAHVHRRAVAARRCSSGSMCDLAEGPFGDWYEPRGRPDVRCRKGPASASSRSRSCSKNCASTDGSGHMKIQQVKTNLVRLPLDEPLVGAPPMPGMLRDFVTVQVMTDDGIEGIGFTTFGGKHRQGAQDRGRGIRRTDQGRGPAAHRSRHRQDARGLGRQRPGGHSTLAHGGDRHRAVGHPRQGLRRVRRQAARRRARHGAGLRQRRAGAHLAARRAGKSRRRAGGKRLSRR